MPTVDRQKPIVIIILGPPKLTGMVQVLILLRNRYRPFFRESPSICDGYRTLYHLAPKGQVPPSLAWVAIGFSALRLRSDRDAPPTPVVARTITAFWENGFLETSPTNSDAPAKIAKAPKYGKSK